MSSQGVSGSECSGSARSSVPEGSRLSCGSIKTWLECAKRGAYVLNFKITKQ